MYINLLLLCVAYIGNYFKNDRKYMCIINRNSSITNAFPREHSSLASVYTPVTIFR